MWTSGYSTGFWSPRAREDDRFPVDYPDERRGGTPQMGVRWNPWKDRLGVGPRWPW